MQKTMQQPFGSGAFQRGTPKQEVLSEWGQPDRIVQNGQDELGNTREKWVYFGRLPSVPVDYGYVSRTKQLYFEGENLVRWETKEAVADSKPEAPSPSAAPLASASQETY